MLSTLKIFANAGQLVLGVVQYLAIRRTPYSAYRSMSRLFCLTGGKSNDLLSDLVAMCRRKLDFSNAHVTSVLVDSDERVRATEGLKRDGYHILTRRIPDDLCDRLLDFACTNPCMAVAVDGATQPAASVPTTYPRNAPNAARYEFDPQQLLRNTDIQDLIADTSLMEVAQDYLGASPLLDVLSMWWHTGFLGRPDSKAAQFFHFDMDRPKWLKVFVFLTEVGPSGGPHVFIRGSHAAGAIPPALLKRGQVRFTDEEVQANYSAEDCIEFVVPRGTVVIEDTRGLHKGKHVESGDRLVLQLQFSNSLFGMEYPAAKISGPITQRLAASMARFPGVYDGYR